MILEEAVTFVVPTNKAMVASFIATLLMLELIKIQRIWIKVEIG